MGASRVVVTGAAGFIGSQVLTRFLGGGWSVTAVVRPGSIPGSLAGLEDRMEIVEADVMNPCAVLRAVPAAPDVFVHAAWETTPGRYLTSEKNLDHAVAAVGLARELAASGCRKFIGLGTCQEYAPSNSPLKETAPIQPRVPYARAKAGAGLLIESLGETCEMDTVWLRVSNVYGPGENENRLVPHVVLSLLTGERARVSSGEQVRDFLHVEDVASAVVRVADRSLQGVVNVGSGNGVRVRRVIEQLAELLGDRELVDFGVRPTHPGELPFVVADNRKLVGAGWKPRYGLRAGLANTIEWWRRRLDPDSRPETGC